MPLAARVSDSHACPQKGHSVNAISSGSGDVFINGLPMARVGDSTSCGATIVAGSSTVFINGKPAALLGAATSHGGVIISGSGNVLIGDAYSPEFSTVESSKSYNQHFQFVDANGKPASVFTYLIETPDGMVAGDVCESGKTQLVHTSTESELLGVWSKDKVLGKLETVTYMADPIESDFEGYVAVYNRDFRRWQKVHNSGGDFVVYSDVKWRAQKDLYVEL